MAKMTCPRLDLRGVDGEKDPMRKENFRRIQDRFNKLACQVEETANKTTIVNETTIVNQQAAPAAATEDMHGHDDGGHGGGGHSSSAKPRKRTQDAPGHENEAALEGPMTLRSVPVGRRTLKSGFARIVPMSYEIAEDAILELEPDAVLEVT